jgi:indole-3-glycerol phosphate synthase
MSTRCRGAELGADCILIIMASVDDALAGELEDAARHWGMDALIEVHDEAETGPRAGALESPLIGVNNRNLNTFETTLRRPPSVWPPACRGPLLIGESGLASPADLPEMARAAPAHS